MSLPESSYHEYFDSEYIVSSGCSKFISFFANTRCFLEPGYPMKQPGADVNLPGLGGLLPQGYTKKVRAIYLYVPAFVSEASREAIRDQCWVTLETQDSTYAVRASEAMRDGGAFLSNGPTLVGNESFSVDLDRPEIKGMAFVKITLEGPLTQPALV
jgi:hypothetical protein